MADDSVDVEQLAALERVMQERDAVPQFAAKVHIVDPIVQVVPIVPGEDMALDGKIPRRMMTQTEVEQRYPAPPKPLASFVEAGAVDVRLTQMQNELAQLRGMLHHVMVLVMVMGDRQKISAQEYDAAAALIAKAEKDGPR